MTVSVSLVSPVLAQTWADRLWARLNQEGLPLSLADLRTHLAVIWGARDWPSLMRRSTLHPDAGVNVVDHEPFTPSQLKGWIKALHRRLKNVGHALPLTRLQTLWAQGMGGASWPGLVHQLPALNAKRETQARALPGWPHLDGYFCPAWFDLETWPAEVRHRIEVLGQRWVDSRHSAARWSKFWPRLAQIERCLMVDMGKCGFFDDLIPAKKGQRLTPLPAVLAHVEPQLVRVHLALRQHVLPRDDLWAALRCLQRQAPADLRVPEAAFSEWIDLLIGDGRLHWSPFDHTRREEACRDIVARHAPAVATHPSFHLVDQWAYTLMSEMFKQRCELWGQGEEVLVWPPVVKLYSEGSETTTEGLPEHWCLRIEQD